MEIYNHSTDDANENKFTAILSTIKTPISEQRADKSICFMQIAVTDKIINVAVSCHISHIWTTTKSVHPKKKVTAHVKVSSTGQ